MSPPEPVPNKAADLFCPCCQWKAPSVMALRYHLFDHSENLTCPLCQMKYGSIIMLTKHFAMHCPIECRTDELGREISFLCRSCNTQVHGLQYHLHYQHPDTEKDVFITKFTFESNGTVKEQYITPSQVRAFRAAAPIGASQPKLKPRSPPRPDEAGPSGVVWPKKFMPMPDSDDDDSDDDAAANIPSAANQQPLRLIPISVPKQHQPATSSESLQKPNVDAEEDVPGVELTMSPPPSNTPPPHVYQDLPHSPPRRYISCEFCKSAFRRLRHYDAHVRTSHKNENAGNPDKPLQMKTFTVERYYDPQVCPVCEEHFFSTDSFKMHVIGHLPELVENISQHSQVGGDAAKAGAVKDVDQRPANSSGDGTSSDDTAIRAYYVPIAKTEEDPDIGLRCYICNLKFKATKGVRIHLLKVHKQDVPYFCPVCGVECYSYNIFVEHYHRGPCKREEEATAAAAKRYL